MTTYFTSDTHFGHGGSLGIFRRPFGSVTEMNETMIERWNSSVAPDDEVWHLGDLALQMPIDKVAELFERLNGFKHLIAGNNDGPAVLSLLGWASVQHYAELEIEGRFLVLCHYPFRSWNRMHKGALNLHGHSHGGLDPLPRQIDVGVDVWDFRPVTLDEILRSRHRRRKAGKQDAPGDSC